MSLLTDADTFGNFRKLFTGIGDFFSGEKITVFLQFLDFYGIRCINFFDAWNSMEFDAKVDERWGLEGGWGLRNTSGRD